MAKVIGDKALNAKLSKLARGVDATDVLLRGAEAVRARYVEMVNEGGGAGKAHVPSLPGQPPNTDTGFLVGSTGTQTERRNEAETYATAAYAEALEFGTERMAPRPAMGPAFTALKQAILDDIRDAVRARRK